MHYNYIMQQCWITYMATNLCVVKTLPNGNQMVIFRRTFKWGSPIPFPTGGACVLSVIRFQDGGRRSAVVSAEARIWSTTTKCIDKRSKNWLDWKVHITPKTRYLELLKSPNFTEIPVFLPKSLSDLLKFLSDGKIKHCFSVLWWFYTNFVVYVHSRNDLSTSEQVVSKSIWRK